MSGAENEAELAENRVERVWQKTMERERSGAEREVAERERSEERAESAAPRMPNE